MAFSSNSVLVCHSISACLCVKGNCLVSLSVTSLSVCVNAKCAKSEFRKSKKRLAKSTFRMHSFCWKFAPSTIWENWFQIWRSFLIIWVKGGFSHNLGKRGKGDEKGQIWFKYWKCSDFAEKLHPAQINDADFKSGGHFSKYSKQKLFFLSKYIVPST